MTDNPYKIPQSDVNITQDIDQDEELRLKKLAFGQKMTIFAVLLYFIAVAANMAMPLIGLLLVFGSWILSLVGLFKVVAAKGSHIAVKILLFILLFVPLINLIVLLRLNSSATKELRNNGYTVGLMGAKKNA